MCTYWDEGLWSKVSKNEFLGFITVRLMEREGMPNFERSFLHHGVASLVRSMLPRDDLFLTTTQASTGGRIKFSDCVYDVRTGETRSTPAPDERFVATVGKKLPARVQKDVDEALRIFQDWFTLLNAPTAPRADAYDFDNMPLWQFVIIAIGSAIAGDCKHAFAMVSANWDSGKSTLQYAVQEAFGKDHVPGAFGMDGVLSPKKLFQAKTPKEFSKFMYPKIAGARILWANGIPPGLKFVDTMLMKRLAFGQDFSLKTCSVRAKLTTFFNCECLPPVRNHGDSDFLLKVVFPNTYVDKHWFSSTPNAKLRDGYLKYSKIHTPSFAAGVMWLILDEYRGFVASGKPFVPIREVKMNP